MVSPTSENRNSIFSIRKPELKHYQQHHQRSFRNSIFERIQDSANDKFLTDLLLKLYFILVLMFCASMNICSMLPGKNSTSITQHDERLYQVILTVLMAIGIALVCTQIIVCRRKRPKTSTSSAVEIVQDPIEKNTGGGEYRRRSVLPRHLIYIMRSLGGGTVFSYAWVILRRIIRKDCDRAIEILNGDPLKPLLLSSDFVYFSTVILLVVVQWYWIERLTTSTSESNSNRLASKDGVLYSLAVVQMLVLDCALYLKVSLSESKAVAGVNQASYNCTQQHGSNLEETQLNESLSEEKKLKLGTYDYLHQHVMDPAINAIVLEGLLTFAIFLYITSNHHAAEARKSSAVELSLLVKQTPTRYSVVAFVGILAVATLPLSICLCYSFFFKLKEHNNNEPDMRLYYGTSFACYLILITLHTVCILYQNAPSNAVISTHAKIDKHLMIGASGGILALAWIQLIPNFYVWHSLAIDLNKYADHCTLHTIQCILKMAHVILQILFIIRALAYRTSSQQHAWRLELPAFLATVTMNLMLWVIDVYSRVAHDGDSKIPFEFYDWSVWLTASEIMYPIAIFFRFHSMICSISLAFSHWKNARRSLSSKFSKQNSASSASASS